jgi:hypothetical protein
MSKILACKLAPFGLALGVLLFFPDCGSRSTKLHAQTSPSPPAAANQPVKAAPATPILTKKVELHDDEKWDPSWDAIVEKALPPEMLTKEVPRDVRRFCPRFYQMSDLDKRAYWAYFFQALAGAEAGLDPTTRVRHTEPEVAVKDSVTGRMVRSEGLLQLTYEDSKRYSCDFNWDADKTLEPKDPSKTILQPKNNLECGVKILSNQLFVLHRPLFWKKGYWSTLESGTMSYRVFAKQMTNPPLACGLKVKHAQPVENAATPAAKTETASR